MPRVSFILPVRNGVATLPAALASLSSQTFADYEVLTFDDGSQDRTLDLLEASSTRYPRVHVVGSARVGLVAALRRLVSASSAPLLARMDADDVCLPRRLERQVELLDTQPALALTSCLIRCFPDQLITAGMRRYEAWLNSVVQPAEIARDIFVESPLCHPSVVLRREAYDAAGGYWDDGFLEDYHLWLRLHQLGRPMAKVTEVLFHWRERSDRVTRTDPRCGPERIMELKVRYLLDGPLADRNRLVIWGAGTTGRRWARRLTAAGREIAALVDVDPRKFGRTIGTGARIIDYEEVTREVPGELVLVAVGIPGTRNRIRDYLSGLGLREPGDFICVA